MAKDDPHFRLRIPPALKATIEKAAVENNRSINAEIISRLEEASTLETLLKEILDRLKASLEREKESVEVMRWFREQQDGFNAVVDMVAESDGTIEPELLSLIRKMAAGRGTNTGFPRGKDD